MKTNKQIEERIKLLEEYVFVLYFVFIIYLLLSLILKPTL